MTNINTIDQSGQDKLSVDQLKDRRVTYIFDDVAEKYGLDEAIFAQRVYFWITKNKKSNKNSHDGRTWTYDSLPNLAKRFKWWTTRQIQRIISSCVSQGLLATGIHGSKKRDRTTWFTLTEKGMLDLCHQGALNIPEFVPHKSESNLMEVRIQELEAELLSIKEKHLKALKTNHQTKRCDVMYETVLPIAPNGLSINRYSTSNPNPTNYEKNVVCLNDMEKTAQYLPPLNKPFFNNNNNLPHEQALTQPVDNFSPISNSNVESATYQSQPAQPAKILVSMEHMLANPLGCSSDKLEAYRLHRGPTMTVGVWDFAIKTLMNIVSERLPSVTPNDVLDVLLKRTDGSTSFDIVFPDARQSANIRAFEKEAAEHDLARGQDIDSLIAEFKRIGIKHNLSQDFDYQSYYAERGKKEAAARNAENMLTSNAHNNPSSGNSDINQSTMASAALKGSAEKLYESYSEEDIKDEPAYRQEIIRAQRASTANPPVSIESNKTAPRIDSEMTMDDSKAISVELMEDPFTSTTGICEEPIANAVCDLPLHSNDFSDEGVAMIGATALLFTKLLSEKSVEEHVNISSEKDLFGGFGKPAIHYTGKIINF